MVRSGWHVAPKHLRRHRRTTAPSDAPSHPRTFVTVAHPHGSSAATTARPMESASTRSPANVVRPRSTVRLCVWRTLAPPHLRTHRRTLAPSSPSHNLMVLRPNHRPGHGIGEHTIAGRCRPLKIDGSTVCLAHPRTTAPFGRTAAPSHLRHRRTPSWFSAPTTARAMKSASRRLPATV